MNGWRNQYMDLVKTKPGLIVAEESDNLSLAGCDELNKRASKYPRLIVELGSGSGGHILEIASKNPDAFCVGFELRFKRTFRTAEKAERLSITNLCLARCNANQLKEIFPEESIDVLYVNFPDPWARKKWHKHRMLNTESLKAISKLLKPGGSLRYKTDHRGYFEDVVENLKETPALQTIKFSDNLHASEHVNDNVLTEFEGLFLSQDLPIYFLEAKRVSIAAE